MARKIKTTKTAAQRRAELETLQAAISDQVEEMRQSESWEKFLKYVRSFHTYSLNNVLLIMSQMPEATSVAGYGKWKTLGRQVRKGEKGIRIFGGRPVTMVEKDAKTGEETEQQRMRFFPVSVFDKSQTDPIDPDAEDVTALGQRLTGEDPSGIYQAVVDFLTGKGWTVTRKPLTGELNGYATMDGSREVVVGANLSPAQAAKTALHEAAHVLLHSDDKPGEYIEHRGIKETEAESVAYIVAGALDLDTSSYSVGYIAGWSNCDAELIKATAGNVMKAAKTLIEALTEPASDEGGQAA